MPLLGINEVRPLAVSGVVGIDGPLRRPRSRTRARCLLTAAATVRTVRATVPRTPGTRDDSARRAPRGTRDRRRRAPERGAGTASTAGRRCMVEGRPARRRRWSCPGRVPREGKAAGNFRRLRENAARAASAPEAALPGQGIVACAAPDVGAPIGLAWPGAPRTGTLARNERRDQNPSRHRRLGRHSAGRHLLHGPRRVASSPRCARARSRLSGHSCQARYRGTGGGPGVLGARVGHGAAATQSQARNG
jgi:hypothetical protein